MQSVSFSLSISGAIIKTIALGEQATAIMDELKACKDRIECLPKGVPKVGELQLLMHKINGYSGAHDMHLRDQYGAKAAEAIRKLSDQVESYRLFVKKLTADTLPSLILQPHNDLISEWALYRDMVRAYGKKIVKARSSKRSAAELYAQFFDTAIAAVNRIKGMMVRTLRIAQRNKGIVT
jgi:hypothetical protein